MSSAAGTGIFGPYHHRGEGGLPDQGHIYDSHGKRIPPAPSSGPGNDGTDYGRVSEGLDQWGVPIQPKEPGSKTGSTGGTTKRQRQGRRGRTKGVARRRKPKTVHIRARAASGGKQTEPYPAASQATGGAMPVREMDALSLSQVGLSGVLAELINHGRVTVSLPQTLAAWQREQDRITNRTWRRPGGLYRPAGL